MPRVCSTQNEKGVFRQIRLGLRQVLSVASARNSRMLIGPRRQKKSGILKVSDSSIQVFADGVTDSDLT